MMFSKPQRIRVGDRAKLEVLDGGNTTLDTTYHKCRWYFPDDKSQPRGTVIYHIFKKRGQFQPTFRVDCKDGTIYRGYMNVIVLEEMNINDKTNPIRNRRQGAVLADLSIW